MNLITFPSASVSTNSSFNTLSYTIQCCSFTWWRETMLVMPCWSSHMVPRPGYLLTRFVCQEPVVPIMLKGIGMVWTLDNSWEIQNTVSVAALSRTSQVSGIGTVTHCTKTYWLLLLVSPSSPTSSELPVFIVRAIPSLPGKAPAGRLSQCCRMV